MKPSARHARLGVLLAEGRGKPEFLGAVRLCEEALAAGGEAYLYCLHEGIRCVGSAELQALRTRGLRLFGCAFAARRRGIEMGEEAVYSGLGVLADIVARPVRTRRGAGAAG